MEGFIILHRRLLEWEWYDHQNVKTIFIHCLLKANFKTKSWRGLEIRKGQFVTSYNTLSIETGLSVQAVRTCLKKLESTNELTIKTTNQNSIITVNKYSLYQSNQQANNKQSTDDQQTDNNQLTTTNNDNNVNNDNKETKEKKETATPKFNFRKSLIELGVEEQVAEDWLKVRKSKKAVNSETAFKMVVSEIGKTKLTANECIKQSAANDWKGFKAEYVRNQNSRSSNNTLKVIS